MVAMYIFLLKNQVVLYYKDKNSYSKESSIHCDKLLMRVFNLFSRKLRFLNKLSLAIGLGISFGLCLLGNFQLHSQRTLAGKQKS